MKKMKKMKMMKKMKKMKKISVIYFCLLTQSSYPISQSGPCPAVNSGRPRREKNKQ